MIVDLYLLRKHFFSPTKQKSLYLLWYGVMPSRSAITVSTELVVIIIIWSLLIVTLQPVKVNMVTAPKYNK